MTIRKHTLKDGSIRYEARFKKKGKEYNQRFEKRSDAVSWLAKMRTDDKPDLGKVTVAQAIDWYIENYYNHKRDTKYYGMRRLARVLHSMKLADLKFSVVEKIVEEIRKMESNRGGQIAEGTARRYFYFLKVPLETYCNRHDLSLDATAFNVEAPAAWEHEREDRVSDEEIALIIASMKNRIQFFEDIIMIILNSGMRLQEALGLKYSEFKTGYIHLPADRTKTGKSRVIPLFPKVIEIVNKRKLSAKSDRVFTEYRDTNSVTRYYRKYVPAHLYERDITMHFFRHEATCRLVEKTPLKMEEIMKITGHDEMRTFNRYYKLRPNFNIAGIESL